MKLSDIPKENPYSTPDGYFNQLAEKIDQRIHQQEKPSLLDYPAIRVAASISIAATLALLISWPFGHQRLTTPEFSPEEVYAYLREENQPLGLDIEEQELIHSLPMEEQDLKMKITEEDLQYEIDYFHYTNDIF
ncbi:hypothetical protein [Persicobacter sp. CCB-QB2]|uniref:hypothetical protein n=1 Tax=Persicobacter sp. CCB-QB2 TaxID=1561025 RepID=UPI0006A9935F|nr:hypothetical protein [Persicobacter sp. CCB-QB2]